MNRSDLWQKLVAIEKHIGEAAIQLRRQRQVVLDSHRRGYDVGSAKQQLALFEKLHGHLITARARLRRSVTAA